MGAGRDAVKRTRLVRRTRLRRVAAMARSRLTTKRAPDPVTAVVRRQLWQRAQGRCERCGEELYAFGWDASHRAARRTQLHDVTNLCCICRPCHAWVESYWMLAEAEGFRVSTHCPDPSREPVFLWRRRWVRLTADGRYEDVA